MRTSRSQKRRPFFPNYDRGRDSHSAPHDDRFPKFFFPSPKATQCPQLSYGSLFPTSHGRREPTLYGDSHLHCSPRDEKRDFLRPTFFRPFRPSEPCRSQRRTPFSPKPHLRPPKVRLRGFAHLAQNCTTPFFSHNPTKSNVPVANTKSVFYETPYSVTWHFHIRPKCELRNLVDCCVKGTVAHHCSMGRDFDRGPAGPVMGEPFWAFLAP